MPKPTTENFDIPKEIFGTGIADAETYNDAMDRIDDILLRGKNWKEPFATILDLPLSGNDDGDTRVVLADAEIYVWVTALGGWQSSTVGGDSHWKAPVTSPLALPTTGNSPGDVRVVLSDLAAYVWSGTGWQYLVALDKTHETYPFARAAILTNGFTNVVDAVPSNLIGYPQRTNGLLIAVTAAFFLPSTCTVRIWNKGVAVLDSLNVVNTTFATKVSSVAITQGMELSCDVVGTANGIVATAIVE
jgi:hypothetical protein